MTRILDMLNTGKYAGDFHWTPVKQWKGPSGEMGVYQTEVTHDYGGSSTWILGVILASDGQRFSESLSERMINPAEKYELIASIFGAQEIKDEQESQA